MYRSNHSEFQHSRSTVSRNWFLTSRTSALTRSCSPSRARFSLFRRNEELMSHNQQIFKECSLYISACSDNPKFFGQIWIMISCKWSSPEIRVAKARKINIGYVSITTPLVVSVTLLEYKNSWIRPALCLVSAAKAGCLVKHCKNRPRSYLPYHFPAASELGTSGLYRVVPELPVVLSSPNCPLLFLSPFLALLSTPYCATVILHCAKIISSLPPDCFIKCAFVVRGSK